MKNIGRFLSTTIASFIYIMLWGYTTLSAGVANAFLAGLMMFAAFLISIFTKRYFLNSRADIFLFMLWPTIYLIVSIYFFFVRSFTFFEVITFPILWLIAITCFALFQKKASFVNTSLMLFLACVYGFFIYPKTGLGLNNNYAQQMLLKDDERCQPNYNYNLAEFLFINYQLDTVCFANLDKPLLVETWNETCPPCIRSIKDLEETFIANPNFDVMYLHQKRGKKWLPNNKAVNYKFIKDKSNIYLDEGDNFNTYMNLASMPNYLMYNRDGELMGTLLGYNFEKKEDFLKSVDSLAKIAWDHDI